MWCIVRCKWKTWRVIFCRWIGVLMWNTRKFDITIWLCLIVLCWRFRWIVEMGHRGVEYVKVMVDLCCWRWGGGGEGRLTFYKVRELIVQQMLVWILSTWNEGRVSRHVNIPKIQTIKLIDFYFDSGYLDDNFHQISQNHITSSNTRSVSLCTTPTILPHNTTTLHQR